MKFEELKTKTKLELKEILVSSTRELTLLKLSKKTSGIKKPHLLKNLKQACARINYLLGQIQ